MGGCTSSPEKPKQNPGSVAFTSQQQAAQLHPNSGPPNTHPMAMQRSAGYPGGQPSHMMPPMSGGGISGPMQSNPFNRGMPGVGSMSGGSGGGALTYIALYDYDARTHEDLTFRKGTLLLCISVCVCVCVCVCVQCMCTTTGMLVCVYECVFCGIECGFYTALLANGVCVLVFGCNMLPYEAIQA